jgi:PAS domain S-box-containing protein
MTNETNNKEYSLEQILRATLYSIGDAVIATDKRGRVTLMNPVAEKLTGWKEREARGKALSTIFRIVNEETRKKVESPVPRVLREGIVVGLANHTILISRNGKEIPIADAGAPIKDESGKVVGVVLVFRDQTAERTAQRAVQDAREFAESVIATVREPLLVLDEKLEVVAANRSFYDVFNVKPEETIGKKVYRLGNGQWNIPALRKLLEDILPSNSHFDDYEVTHDFEHIGRRTMLLNARRLFREANRSKLILLAIEDITERKQAEEALKESEERFHRISDLTSDYAYAFRVEKGNRLVLEWVTDSFTRITGYTPQEVDERGGWPSLIHPDDMPIALARAQRLFSGEDDVSEFRIVRKDGQSRWLRDHGHPVWDDKQQRVVRIYGAAQDITEQKRVEETLRESELRFRSVWENATDGMRITNEEGTIVMVNEAYCKMVEKPRQELEGKPLSIVYEPTRRDDVVRKHQERFRSRTIPPYLERELTLWNGKKKSFALSNTFLELSGRPLLSLSIFRDITERKRAEEELQRSHEWLNSIFEASRDGIIVEDNEQIVYVNRAAVQLYGYSDPQEMIGKHVSLLQSGEDNERMLEYGRKRERGEPVPTQYEFKGRRKDGSLFDCEISVSQGTIGGRTLIIAVLRDITERRKAQKQIDMLAQAMRSTSECVSITDLEDKLLFVNEAFLKTYGYKEEELLGKPIGIVRSPNNAPGVVSEILPATLRGSWQGELLNRRKDGSDFPIFLSTSVVHDDRGRPVALGGVATDITERKRAEEEIRQSRERYERFFMEDLTGDYISTPDGRLLACNPAFVRIFGFASAEEALSTNMTSLFRTPEERQRLLSLFQRERKLEYYEMQMRKLDGTPLYLIANIIGRFDEHDRLVEMQGYLFDDTKRQQLEEQLRHTQKLESLGTLASGIAHDFNNILGIILGHAALLDRFRNDPTKFSQSLDAVSSATKRGAALVKQMLTFARKTESLVQPLDLNTLVKEVAKMLYETFPRTITIERTLDPTLPAIIADATQIHQVLLNLSVNARDAMPKGGTLRFSTSVVTAAHLADRFATVTAEKYVALTITDTGMGMDEKTRERIFEPFFTTKGPGRGTGLGLSVVHGVVGAHGGFIDVESQLGKGTTFRIYFPATEQTALEFRAANEAVSELLRGTETILFVEDEESLRQVVEMGLTSAGYKVLLAGDGQKGLDIYRERMHEIALVISDIGLPVMTGDELFKEIKRINSNAKVILASGFVDPQAKSELLKGGVKEFVGKPYTLNEILQKARTVINAN